MSIERTTYIGLYVDIDKYIDDPYEDKMLPYTEGHKDIEFDLIYDGMCGDYMYFGKTYGKIDEYEENTKLIINNNIRLDMIDIIQELIKLGIRLEDEDEILHMVFMHIS